MASREPIDVVMAPFSAKSVVTFEEVPVTKTARRYLHIRNPTDEDLKVFVKKMIGPEFNLTIDWIEKIVPAKGVVVMELMWSPVKEVSCKESIQLMDNRNLKKEVIIILKSVDKSNNKGLRKPMKAQNATAVLPKKIRHRSPSRSTNPCPPYPTQTGSPRANHKLVQFSSPQYNSTQNTQRRPNFDRISPLRLNNQYYPQSPKVHRRSSFEKESYQTNNKENRSPITPTNASALFDDIKFTPIVDKVDQNMEYLASLPTPTIAMTQHTRIEYKQPRKLMIDEDDDFSAAVTESKRLMSEFQSNANKLCQEFQEATLHSNFIYNEIDANEKTPKCKAPPNSGTETITKSTKNLLSSSIVIDKTFDIQLKEDRLSSSESLKSQNADERDDCKVQLKSKGPSDIAIAVNKTQTMQSHNNLYAIQEENDSSNISNAAVENLKRDVMFVGSPLRKKVSKSMRELTKNLSSEQKMLKCNQGSMPNLNDIETMESIESNRYYHQSLDQMSVENSMQAPDVTDSHEVIFKENEILAQSSLFNLHEAVDIKMSTITTMNFVRKSTSEMPPPKTPNLPKMKRNHDGGADSHNESLNTSSKTSSTSSLNYTVSPPKRTRFVNGESQQKPKAGQAFLTDKWSGTQSKKIQPQMRQLIMKQRTPNKFASNPSMKDERIILYDSELHFKCAINPDPFAATVTEDPFLASTMYLDQRAVDKHETQFKKWLNALVTLPADLDAANANQNLDVGRLFNEVKNKDFIPAQTKEVVSSKFFNKYRIDSLRRAGIKLFTSPEMIKPLTKVTVSIEKGHISIREDRNLHLDLVLQRHILELLLCFNPLWLRIGLEVVFGEQIHVQSNTDLVGLSTFIINRMFKDKYIEGKHSRAYSFSSGYAVQIKKFCLKKFLFLVLFLDMGKKNQIIMHNPCLFVKHSPYKETKDILLKFSSSLLANVGSITRDLGRFGYVLTHKQTYIDEFDYAFHNLAVDLRDGVRLTKVMEIILLRDDLTKALRCPAISRLQRVHNVKLGLNALSDAGYVILGDINAKEIVDGHREKTLSLLWQIIYKFRAPKFNAAATEIQEWWRRKWLMVVINRRIAEKRERLRNEAATIIQAAYRAHLARKFATVYRYERTEACVILQKYVRRYLAIKHVYLSFKACIMIQKWWRTTKLTRTYRLHFVEVRTSVMLIQKWWRRHLLARKLEAAAPIIKSIKEEARVMHEKATILQRCIKSYVVRRRFRETVFGVVRFNRTQTIKFKSATRIQSFFKMMKCRREFLKQRNACCIIQRRWRFILAARTIRKEFLQLKSSALFVQQKYRAGVEMKMQRSVYLKMRSAAIVIQQRYCAQITMRRERNAFNKLKEATVIIQRQFRANLEMKRQRNDYQNLLKSSIVVQRRFRTNVQRKSFLQIKSAALVIQHHFRAQQKMMQQKSEFLKIKEATLCIQRRFRANQEMKRHRSSYQHLIRSTIYIQRYFRTYSKRKTFLRLKSSTMIIQKHFRAQQLMQYQRLEFTKLKTTTIFIQRLFRANLKMKIEKNKYEQLRKSAVCIQQKFRALKSMRRQRVAFIKLKDAALTFQAHYFAKKLMQKNRATFLQLKHSTIFVQRRFRANKQMLEQRREYQHLQLVTVRMQRRFRANMQMMQQRSEYLCLRHAAVTIQRQFRATLSMKRELSTFIQLKTSTIFIQRHFRNNLVAKKCILQYTKLRNAAIVMQRRFRAKQLMISERNNYQQLMRAVMNIQCRFRANKLMKIERNNFELQRHSALVIQRRFRARQAMQTGVADYQILKKAVVTIQHRFKCLLIMKSCRMEYLRLRTSTICIQQRFRAILLMRSERKSYLIMRQKTVCIQRYFRATMQMHVQRKEYLLERRSVIVFQTHVRAFILMKKQRQQFQCMKSAAIVIQQRLRCWLVMRQERHYYCLLKQSTIIIQTRFRALLKMKHQRSEYLNLKKAAVCIQTFYRSLVAMQIERDNYQRKQQACLIIQRRFRAQLEMQKIRNQYLLIRSLIICIQRKYRGKLLMRVQRESYLKMKAAAIVVQQIFRSRLEQRAEQLRFQQKCNAIYGLQRYIRGYLARQRMQEKMTPEMVEHRRQIVAARKVQAIWRGYVLRKKQQTKEMKKVSAKLVELRKESTPSNTVRSKLNIWIKLLKRRYNVQEALSILIRLENMSRTVPQLLLEDATFISTFCHMMMAQTIRSEIDKKLIELCSRIILNMARYGPSMNCTFQPDGLVTIAQMLLRWCDKECDIFNTLCSLVWVYSQCPFKKAKIRKFMTTHEAIFMLRETQKLVHRKEKMKRNVQRPMGGGALPVLDKRLQPALETDFGLNPQYKYKFVSLVFAFDSVLASLDIKL